MDSRKKIFTISSPILFLFLFAVIFYQSQLNNISSVVNRNNDLSVSKDAFSFLKYHVVNNSIVPLWQNYMLSSSSFISDPQNPLMYPPNYISILTSNDMYFILSFLGNFILGSIGMYLLTRKIGFTVIPSIITSIIYAYSPKFIGHFEAGHLSLLISYMWFPYVIYAIILIKDSSSILGSIILGISLWSILINYVSVFPYVVAACFTLVLYFILTQELKIKQLKNLILGLTIFLCLSSPFLVSTIPYLQLTTRKLIVDEDIGPRILSYKHFLSSIVFPYSFRFNDLGTETVLYIGFGVLLLGLFGFFIIKNRYKIAVAIVGFLSIFLALGFKTSFYPIVLKLIPVLYLFRITTRFWFIPIFCITLLAGYFINRKVRNKFLQLVLLIIVASELFIFKTEYLTAKASSINDYRTTSDRLYDFVTKDEGYYRIMCAQDCIDTPIKDYKGLTSGYNPIQLTSYYEYFQKASGYNFASYAPALPPYQTFVDKPQPDSQKAGVLGVRYVISPYELIDKGFNFEGKIDELYVYKNQNEQPRVYGVDSEGLKHIIKPKVDKPGLIVVPIDKNYQSVIVSEIYMPFWKAGDMEGNNIKILEKDGIILEVKNVKPSLLTFTFKPPLLDFTVAIWFITLFFILFQSVKIIKSSK